MCRAAARAAWASLVAAFVVLPLVAGAQVPSDPLRGARITQVEIVLLPPPADPQAARNLEGAVRKAFRVYPGDQYDVTRVDFEMAASAVAAEGGWWFGKTRWAPSVTYRFTSTTGDDPASGSFERWDLLYSGGDIDTWVQGQLMKNIHYNSNVQMHRVMARARVKPTWRLTGSFSNFRANALNNLGGVIATFATHDVGRKLLFVSEHNLSRNMYVRLTQGTLWPGSGVRGVLASPVASPWVVGILTLSIDY